VETLQALGFTCFNVAGSGGTSFPAIETARSGDKRRQFLADWGIPTAWSLLDVSQSASPWDTVIAPGGLRNGLDLAKALALGADAAGMSANVLALTLGLGVDAAASALKDILADLQDVMVLTGAATIKELRRIPLVFTGTLLDFVRNRGYDVGKERRPRAGTRRKRG